MAIVCGSEPSFSLALRLSPAKTPSTSSKTPAALALSNRTKIPRTKSLLSTETLSKSTPSMESPEISFTNLISSITSREMVDDKFLNELSIYGGDKVTLPNLKLSLGEYLDWEDSLCDDNAIRLEYDNATSTITLSYAPSLPHSQVQQVFCTWLDEIEKVNQGFLSCLEQFLPFESDTRRPDISLLQKGKEFPSIIVEVGVTQTLESLFNLAEFYFRHASPDLEVVILIKVHEEGREQIQGFPWGLDRTKLREAFEDHTLGKIAKAWMDEREISVIGDLNVHLYFWDKSRKHRPPKPLWRCKVSSITSRKEPGVFCSTMRNEYLDKHLRLKFCDGLFELPVEIMEQKLQKSLEHEHDSRIRASIAKYRKQGLI